MSSGPPQSGRTLIAGIGAVLVFLATVLPTAVSADATVRNLFWLLAIPGSAVCLYLARDWLRARMIQIWHSRQRYWWLAFAGGLLLLGGGGLVAAWGRSAITPPTAALPDGTRLLAFSVDCTHPTGPPLRGASRARCKGFRTRWAVRSRGSSGAASDCTRHR